MKELGYRTYRNRVSVRRGLAYDLQIKIHTKYSTDKLIMTSRANSNPLFTDSTMTAIVISLEKSRRWTSVDIQNNYALNLLNNV